MLKAACRAESGGSELRWAAARRARREAVRTWSRRVGVLAGTPLTRDLGLDAGLVIGAEELRLDGLHHTFETSAGT